MLVFVKEPVPGRVKTRLGRDVGMVSAAMWFRHQSCAQIRSLSADPRWETWIAVSPDRSGLESRVWPTGVRRWPQGRGDLGDRMARAVDQFPPGPLIIIGGDIPELSRDHIWSGFQALGQADVAIGPAADGGFWLIGFLRSPRRRSARLFEGVRWSSRHARADTEASLKGLRVTHLAVLHDVDTAADLPKPIP